MKLTLYCSPTSPYARKVRIAIVEMGIEDSVMEVHTDPFNAPQEFLIANPLSKLPALVTERGDALPDSALILDYLTHRFHGLAPLPRGNKRWEVLRRGKLADGILDAAVTTLFEKRRPEGIHYTPWLDRQAAAIQRALDALNTEAGFLSADKPGVAEVTAGAALGYLDFRMPYLEWRKARAPLGDWYTQFAQRPSMVRTAPPAAA